MLQTFFIYTITFLLILSFSWRIKTICTKCYLQLHSVNVYVGLMLLVFTFVFGLRYNVGIDYENYLYALKHHEYEELEFIFRWVSKFFTIFELPTWLYFSLWAFIQFFFFLFAFKDEKKIYPYLVIVLFLGQYFMLWMNVIRQDTATCIVMCMISYLIIKDYKKYILLACVALGFHTSSLMMTLCLLAFIWKKDYLKIPIIVQLALLLVSFYVFASNINVLGDIDLLLNVYLSDTTYDKYSYGAILNTTEENVIGGTLYVNTLIDVLCIAYSEKMKKFYNNDKFTICYNLYFIGAILGLLFGFSFILLRPVRYFRFFKLVIVAYLLNYLHCQKSTRTTLIFWLCIAALFALYVAMFSYSSDSCYEYHFCFSR